MDDLRIGIIGCGNISSAYLKLAPLFRGLQLAAVADIDMAAAEARAGEFNLRAHTVDDLLAADDIDIIVNLTVPDAHFDISRAALQAGKHVYSEQPDVLPPEEADELVSCCREKNIKNIFIVAPTTPEERIPKIIESASGFIYYVSRAGVTGEQKELASDLEERVTIIKKYTDLPVVVGFGISSPEQASAVGQVADGVVVGSTLVNCISSNLGEPSKIVQAIGDRAQSLSSGL